jgi:quercetin dioxygenase-like cupin family protein
MIVKNVKDAKEQKLETYNYKGNPYPMKEVYIRWLSMVGADGAPEYGLRYFTLGPGGEIPIHNHLYHQTMYILTGLARCLQHDSVTGQIVGEKTVGPGDYVFVPTMEVHSMRNESAQEAVTFLCCIANVYEKQHP